MNAFHIVLIIVLVLEGIVLLSGYVLNGGLSGVFLIAGVALPLAIIPFLLHKLRAVVRQDEKVLAASRDMMTAILETVEGGVIIVDERGVVESLNEAAALMFGYLRSDVEGKSISLLIPDMKYQTEGSPADAFLGRFSTDNTEGGQDITGMHSDGSTFSLGLTAHQVQLKDKSIFILSLQDLSELEKTERIKDEFISTVSHEIRTPLTSILGALGIVAGGLAGEMPDEAKKIIEIAHRNAQGLIDLVNDILDLSRLESDVQQERPRPVRLSAVIRQVAEDLQPYADQYNVSLRLDEGHEDSLVLGREEQLRQVMANLISNAVKYSPPAGTVEIALERSDGTIRVSVTDHGPGVPEEFRSRIFQKFAQADSSDSRSRGGTGLGLNITRKIIEKHGGRIDYDTTPGVATTFYFELPEVREEVPAPSFATEIMSEGYFDETTGLMAHARFDRELDKEWRRAGRSRSPMSLILMSVDHFGMYRDMYGADSIDDCLIRLSATINQTLKRAGDVVARYGEDMFAVLLADTDHDGGVFVAEKIRAAISELGIECALPQCCGYITVSQGIVAGVPERMTGPGQFMEKAQQALMEARAAGGNMVIYGK